MRLCGGAVPIALQNILYSASGRCSAEGIFMVTRTQHIMKYTPAILYAYTYWYYTFSIFFSFSLGPLLYDIYHYII